MEINDVPVQGKSYVDEFLHASTDYDGEYFYKRGLNIIADRPDDWFIGVHAV